MFCLLKNIQQYLNNNIILIINIKSPRFAVDETYSGVRIFHKGEEMKRYFVLLSVIFLLLILLNNLSASLNVSLSDQGSNVKEKSTGNLVNGNLKVYVYDNLTGGNLIYSETFTNAIINGSWNVMLGANPANLLSLEYGKKYYRDYEINGVNIDFTDYLGNTVGRQFFYSPLGDISGAYIQQTSNLTAGIISTPQICLNGDCRSAWPSGSSGSSIIASGSNVNGTYIEFSDGTMVEYNPAWNFGSCVASGSPSVNWTFPVPFVNTNFTGVLTNVNSGGYRLLPQHTASKDTLSTMSVYV
jgi:hypothetical protein